MEEPRSAKPGHPGRDRIVQATPRNDWDTFRPRILVSPGSVALSNGFLTIRDGVPSGDQLRPREKVGHADSDVSNSEALQIRHHAIRSMGTSSRRCLRSRSRSMCVIVCGRSFSAPGRRGAATCSEMQKPPTAQAMGVSTVRTTLLPTTSLALTGPNGARGTNHGLLRARRGPSTWHHGTIRARCQERAKRDLRPSTRRLGETRRRSVLELLARRLAVLAGGISWKTRSALMRRVLEKIQLYAAQDANLFFGGESGVGKTEVARYAHALSKKANAVFYPLNSAALNASLKSELLGYTKGAFTSAARTTDGHLRAAHGGTLYLEEALSLPTELQAAMLDVLDTRSAAKVGSTRRETYDFRVMAASRWRPAELIAKGLLHEDYWHRLSTFVVEIPPLRERMEDLPELFDALLVRAGHKTTFKEMTAAAQRKMLDYDWPGNVRELKAVAKRAKARSSDRRIEAEDIERDCDNSLCAEVHALRRADTPSPVVPAKQRRTKWSRDLVDKARELRDAGMKLEKITAKTGIPVSTLSNLLRSA